MTERRQFCPRGHDTALVGRDSSYRCLACKREAMNAARAAREAEARAARNEEIARQITEADRARERERARILKAGGPVAREQRWEDTWHRRAGDVCQWSDDEGYHICTRRLNPDGDMVYCPRHSAMTEPEVPTVQRL